MQPEFSNRLRPQRGLFTSRKVKGSGDARRGETRRRDGAQGDSLQRQCQREGQRRDHMQFSPLPTLQYPMSDQLLEA